MHITEQPPRYAAGRSPAQGWFPGSGTEAGPSAGAGAVPLSLICFPYAGGTPSVYRNWAQYLGGRVRVVPVLLPGRGLRLREAPYTEMGPLAADIADALVECGLAREYALFGHSMGALLAYEVACELRGRGMPEPVHLFVSGSKAPHLYGDRADHTLSDEDLRQLVLELGSVGPDDTVGSSYLQRRLPVLRADLTVCEAYRWSRRAPLGCPMTAFSATRDPIAPALQVEAWREYTTGSLLRHHLEGNHFFLNGPTRLPLLREIRAELARLLPWSGAPAPDSPDRLLTSKRAPS